MSSRVFIDITANSGGRVYVIDSDDRLKETFSFSLDESMTFTLEGTIPEDMDQSVVSIPTDWLDFRALDMDMPDAAAARAVLPFELDGLLVGDPSDYIIDAIVSSPKTPDDIYDRVSSDDATETAEADTSKVLALYMPAAKIGELISGLSVIGIDPRYITSLDLASAQDDLMAGNYSAILSEHLTESAEDTDEPKRVDIALTQFDTPAINLRMGEFAFKGDVRRGLKKIRLTFVLLTALMMVLALTSTINAISSSRQAAALEQQVLGIYAEIFPGKKPANARGLSYKVRSKLKEYRNKAETMGSLDVLATMKQLQGTIPDGIKMTDMTLSREGVVLKGEGESLELIEQTRNLMESFLFDVKIAQTGKAVSGLTDFNITARMTEQKKRASR